MGSGTSSRTVRLEVLERVSRPLLVRVLAPFAETLARAGVPLDELAASAQTDRALVHRLFGALHAPTGRDPSLAILAPLLGELSAIATESGRDALRRLDHAGSLPLGVLGLEDFAATALLEAPELFEGARVHGSCEAVKAFCEYDAVDVRPLVVTAARVAAFDASVGAFFESRDRTRYCKTVVTETEDTVVLQIAHGRPPGTRDVIGQRLDLAQVTDVETQRAHIVFHKRSCRIAVHALPAARATLCRLFGEAFWGDAGHFAASALFDLSAFRELDVALSPEGVPGLLAVELRAIHLEVATGAAMKLSYNHGCLRSTAEGEYLQARARVYLTRQAKLALVIARRPKPLLVEVSHGNRVEFSRKDAEDARVVWAYFRARGISREGARAADVARVDEEGDDEGGAVAMGLAQSKPAAE